MPTDEHAKTPGPAAEPVTDPDTETVTTAAEAEIELEATAVEPDALAAAGAPLEVTPVDLPSARDEARLLSFYDRLRARIVAAVERRGGKLGSGTVKALLLVPDIFLLLIRLVLDKEVPTATRALVGSVLAYFVLPFDLLPEAILGGAGFLDDLVLATAVLSHAFGGELETYARKHWSGPEDLRIVLRDVTRSASTLVGPKPLRGLQRILGKAGIELPAPGDERE